MIRLNNSLLVLLFPIFFGSCATQKIPFTQQLREKHQLKSDELKSIQFYLSNDLVLKRGDQVLKKETNSGELTVTNDAVIEEIIFKAGTPCVIKDVVDGDRVQVSFESGGEKYLIFGSLKNRDGYYTLQAFDWNKDKGKVNYGEKVYMTSPGSRDVFLVLKMKSLDKFRVDQKVVKGMELNK